jgi:hypothetical protein
MKKVYLVLIEKQGVLKVVAEHENIKECNEYLKDNKYRIVDCWRKS